MKTNFLHASQWARHPAYAEMEGRVDRLYAALACSADDATPEAVAQEVWDAATDGSNQISYLVTRRARVSVAAREAAGTEGVRAHLSELFNA